MSDEHLKMCADEHPTITFNPDFHEGRCPLCRSHDLVDELQLQLQLLRQERDRYIEGRQSPLNLVCDKSGLFQPQVTKWGVHIDDPAEGINVDDLREEIEQQYQGLCGKAQMGGPATLDDLADVAGTIAKMMQVLDDLATGVIRMQYAPDRERPQAGTEEVVMADITQQATAHTPGPWTISGGSPYRVMSANKQTPNGIEYGAYICDTANNAKTRTPENAANARLIAAAPDLLQALKDAQEELRLIRMKDSGVVYDPTLRIRMELAIRKAEGRQ